MSVQSEVAKRRIQASRPKTCKLGEILSNLDHENYEALGYAIEQCRHDLVVPQSERIYTISWLAIDVLKNNGYSIGKTVVREHLLKECACDDSQ